MIIFGHKFGGPNLDIQMDNEGVTRPRVHLDNEGDENDRSNLFRFSSLSCLSPDFTTHPNRPLLNPNNDQKRPNYPQQRIMFIKTSLLPNRKRIENAQLRLACDVAIQRQSKQIGLEDFLFLLRKDKVKLCRLLRHFSLKDMRNRMSSEQWTDDQTPTLDETVSSLDAGCTMDFDEEELLNALILEQKSSQPQDSFYSTAIATSAVQQPSDPNSPSGKAAFPQPAKRLKLCLDFLASIDQTGELDRYLQEDQFFDELKHNRMMVSTIHLNRSIEALS